MRFAVRERPPHHRCHPLLRLCTSWDRKVGGRTPISAKLAREPHITTVERHRVLTLELHAAKLGFFDHPDGQTLLTPSSNATFARIAKRHD